MITTITRHTATELQRDHLALTAAFRAIFARDFVEASHYIANLHRHSQRPDFRCLLAHADDRSDPLLGLAYGYTSQPGRWFHDTLAPAFDPTLAARWLIGAFEFAQFGVVPEARRQGIGARLHDTCFAGLPHRAAILSAPLDNTTAIGFYRRRGWQPLLEDFRLPGGTRPYLILGLALQVVAYGGGEVAP